MHHLYDKFLSDSLSPEEENELYFLLEDKNNKKDFNTYLRDIRDTNAALYEPCLRQAYLKSKPKNKIIKFPHSNWFKFVAIILMTLSISYSAYHIKKHSITTIATNHVSMKSIVYAPLNHSLTLIKPLPMT